MPTRSFQIMLPAPCARTASMIWTMPAKTISQATTTLTATAARNGEAMATEPKTISKTPHKIETVEACLTISTGVLCAQSTPVEMVKHASTVSILWGVLLIVFGSVAIASPFLAAVAVSVVVAWLIVLAGIVHIMLAVRAHGAGSMIWKLLVGIAYLCFGGYLIVHPVLGVASLTLVLACLFLVEGVLDIVLYVKMRPLHGSSWMLLDGIITLLLGAMIYLQWPSSSLWAIGTLVGISMIFSGVARVGMSLAVRKVAGTASSSLAA